jgi:hypothetical protein
VSPTYWRGNGRHSARPVAADECEQDELNEVVDPVGPDVQDVVPEGVGSGPYPRRRPVHDDRVIDKNLIAVRGARYDNELVL